METSAYDVGVRVQALTGEHVSGDATAVVEKDRRLLAALADGLGHGVAARESAVRAIEAACEHAFDSLEGALRAAHDVLVGQRMRGAVIGLALFDADAHTVTFGGIGNIDLIVVDGSEHRLIAHHGVLGGTFPRLRTYSRSFSAAMLALLCSDGISNKLDARQYQGLETLSAQTLADAIVRDAGRTTDDATAVVVRQKR